MDTVVPYHGINRPMELDPGNLIPVILILYMNIVDMIAVNFAEGGHRST